MRFEIRGIKVRPDDLGRALTVRGVDLECDHVHSVVRGVVTTKNPEALAVALDFEHADVEPPVEARFDLGDAEVVVLFDGDDERVLRELVEALQGFVKRLPL